MKQFKGVNRGVLEPKNRVNSDYLYYWHNNRLVYYGSIPGTGRTIHCDNIEAVELMLNYRRNENFIE